LFVQLLKVVSDLCKQQKLSFKWHRNGFFKAYCTFQVLSFKYSPEVCIYEPLKLHLATSLGMFSIVKI